MLFEFAVPTLIPRRFRSCMYESFYSMHKGLFLRIRIFKIQLYNIILTVDASLWFMQVPEHWHSLPTEAVGLLLSDTQKPLGILLTVSLLEQGLGHTHRCLPVSTTLRFCDMYQHLFAGRNMHVVLHCQ